jgi:hypothetical protein
MNETPETEALKLDLDRRKLGPLTKLDVYDELARKLEVERDEARRHARIWESMAQKLAEGYQEARKKAERERDELRKALSDLTAPTPETEESKWVKEVRLLARELHDVLAAWDAAKKKCSALSGLTFQAPVASYQGPFPLPRPWPWPWASIFGDQPDDYYEAKDDLNQLAGKSMRLEARIVKNVMDGCREEGSHE